MINEVDADTPGTDSAEFVELYDGGAGNTPLDGLIVVFFDGGLSPFTGNQSIVAFDLDAEGANSARHLMGMGRARRLGLGLTGATAVTQNADLR